MLTCSAKHILVETEAICLDLKKQIEAGTSFDDIAKKHSSCPSGQRGGDLGQFQPGMMVAEFDKVCFTEEVGKVQGPIKTQFGYHLILITERSGKVD
ncbi:MAG: peptidylprolyl isomerase [Proteobacteria bacterium]|nr:peptidylprolyl isomerase [Pseudomonadota bacterium]